MDMQIEDNGEVMRKVEVASKFQDDIGRKYNNLMDLIIEGHPDILEEKGFLCRCRRASSDHGLDTRNYPSPTIRRPQTTKPILDMDLVS